MVGKAADMVMTAPKQKKVLDVSRLYERLGYHPHPGQQRVHGSRARFKVANCGRRWGKSMAGPHDMVPYMLLREPTMGWIVAPTYDLGEKEFRVFWKILIEDMKIPVDKSKTYYNVRTKDFRITTAWGSVLEVRSAEHPESLVGEGLDWVIMAEAAKLKLSHWEKYIRPTLSDKRGRAIFVSTPEGFNWFYEMFQLGRRSDLPDWWSIKSPTWDNVIKFPGGAADPEILDVKNTLAPEVFDQEYGAEFTSFAGRIYSEFDEGYHVMDESDFIFNPTWENYLGIDFGWRNPTAVLNVQVSPMDDIYIWDEYYERKQTPDQHARNLQSLIQWRVDGAYYDPSGTQQANTFAAVWRDSSGYSNPHLTNVEFTPAPNDQILGIGRVKEWLELKDYDATGKIRPKLFVTSNCVNTIKEFNTYVVKNQGERAGETADPQEKPRKKDDHAMDALRYMICGKYGLKSYVAYQD